MTIMSWIVERSPFSALLVPIVSDLVELFDRTWFAHDVTTTLPFIVVFFSVMTRVASLLLQADRDSTALIVMAARQSDHSTACHCTHFIDIFLYYTPRTRFSRNNGSFQAFVSSSRLTTSPSRGSHECARDLFSTRISW